MQIFNNLTYIDNSSLALGFFDGIHLGHRVVLKNAINIAKKFNTVSTVIVFRNHPLLFVKGIKVEQILTLNEKLEIMKKVGIDNVILLDFENFASVKACDYLKNVLVKYFSPISITTGFNHNFGFNKEGNTEFLKKNSENFGYKYYEIPPFTINGNVVSCSNIRKLISTGDFYSANKMLGYNFFIRSKVIKGEQIASNLGFPSANINYPVDKIKIPFGVYFVKVKVNDKVYNGVLNHGNAPTLNNENIKTEIHIINFNQDIYGKNIEISFLSKIRNQIEFENIEKLKAQINRDIAFTDIYSKFLNDKYIML